LEENSRLNWKRQKFSWTSITAGASWPTKQIIADALKQFGSVVKSLPEADQTSWFSSLSEKSLLNTSTQKPTRPPRKKVCLKRKSELNGIWLTFHCSQVTYFQQVCKLGK